MKNSARSLVSVLALMLSTYVIAAEPYKNIVPAQPTQVAEGKIEVVEIFWYGCPHCYDFEPHVNNWVANLPEDVEFRRMPGIFSKSWVAHARAYYAAEKLGVLEQIHTPLFEALHKDRKRIFSESELKDFFESKGVDGDEFTRAYNSNEVEVKFKQAFLMGQRYKITGVPAVVVNGKYMTGAALAGSYDNLLKTMDMLVDKERGE